MFETVRGALRRARSDIIAEHNAGSNQTILVLGELHYVAAVQYRLLQFLEQLWNETRFPLLGREGAFGKRYHKKLARIRKDKRDYRRALNDPVYLKKLLVLYGIGAADIFAAEHARDLSVEGVDVDPELDRLVALIDDRCAAAYLRGVNEPPLAPFGQFQFETFRQLLRDVVVGLRSDWMVMRLFVRQQEIGAELAVLSCGAAHTPAHPAYMPYSVTRTLEVLPVNYLIALPEGCQQVQRAYLKHRDPWDFYTKEKTGSGDTTDLFETRDPYASKRA